MKNNFFLSFVLSTVLGSESPMPKKDMGRNKHGMPKISFYMGYRDPDSEKKAFSSVTPVVCSNFQVSISSAY